MIEVSLIVMSGLAMAALLRRQSAATRHWVLSTALLCAAAAPALDLVVPAWNLRPSAFVAAARTPRQQALAADAEKPLPQSAAARIDQSPGLSDRIRASVSPTALQLIVPVWITGAAISLFILLVGLGRLAWLASGADRLRRGRWVELAVEIARGYGVRRPVLLLQTDHPTLLVTWGLRRPKIILPKGASEWTDERVRVVLCHELAHIRRQDWVVQMLAELLRAVYWFNPLVWIASRRLRQESEQACDDAVLSLGIEGVNGPEYAEHLLALARDVCRRRRTFLGLPAPAMVSLMRPSSLERRVRAMLNTRLNRRPTTRLSRVATALGVLGISVLIVGFGATAQTFSTFSGSVVDPMNGLIPKATLILTDVVRQAKHEVRTDENGRFEFVGLPPGDYLFEVRFPGFGTLKGTVSVAGQNVHKNLELQVGTLQETISVKGKPGTVPASVAPAVIGAQSAKPRGPEGCTVSPTSATGGNIRPPRKLKDVKPIYPANLQDARVGGAVLMEGRIGTDGSIRELQVVKAAHPELASAAVEAVRQWQFDATLLNCVPVEVLLNITVNFSVE
jgi:TonB family protein